MAVFIIGYTIIFAIIAFFTFVMLVGKGRIFKNNPKIRNIFGRPLLVYSVRRIISAFISVILAISATFLLIRLQDTRELCKQAITSWDKLSPYIREQRCADLKAELGLSGSALKSLFKYYYQVLPFPKTLCVLDETFDGVATTMQYRECRNFLMDLGKIYFMGGGYNGQFVIDVIFKQKMVVSFQIGILGAVMQLVLGYPMGILMAKYKDGWYDRLGKAYIITIDAIPGVAYYYIWMSIFVLLFGLPFQYNKNDFLSWLPAILTMGFTGMAGIALWVRRYMLNEFTADYVKFARAKGLTENRIMYVHVLRNALVPLVRSIPAAILGSLLGSFYIEKIYAIPGLGGFLVTANATHDIYAIQGIVVVSALISILAYVSGDIVTALVDPRISFTSE
ncbi:MAG: ABC transporter permease [Bacilli bacterium]|jgi:oligopeptide transport system permease protein